MLTGDVPRGMFKLPSEKVPGLDPRYDAIICKAMEEEREERFQSVAEMRAELAGMAAVPSLALVLAGGRIGLNQGELVVHAPARQLHFRRLLLSGMAASAMVTAGWLL